LKPFAKEQSTGQMPQREKKNEWLKEGKLWFFRGRQYALVPQHRVEYE